MFDALSPMRSIPAADLTPDEMYLLMRDSVMPRPIAWVSTVDAAGASNLAPYSFFNVCSPEPPVLGFAVGPRSETPGAFRPSKDTLDNIRSTGELVINVVPESLAEQMVRTSTDLAPGESEFELAGLQPVPSLRVRPPRVAGVPVAYECVLHTIVEVGTHRWVMARVIHVHVDERVYLGERKGLNHRIDLTRHEALRPIGRLGRAQYVRLREIETMTRRDGTND